MVLPFLAIVNALVLKLNPPSAISIQSPDVGAPGSVAVKVPPAVLKAYLVPTDIDVFVLLTLNLSATDAESNFHLKLVVE